MKKPATFCSTTSSGNLSNSAGTNGTSGVMTFMVNEDGVVWQRDLGADTPQSAAAIQQFNPDNSWTPLAPEG